jgi:predicted 3-demethylubiquinone-9 3-methyltransferase (glyoxalase superfamily)
MPTVTPFLWFDSQAEEAMNFYVSIFPNAKAGKVYRRGNGSAGSVTFEIEGQKLMGFNGGPHFKMTEAISLFVSVETQEEVDTLWEKLSEGGQKSRCGWLKDKFGLSWQIIPKALETYLHAEDPEKAQRVMQAMMKMSKIDIAALKAAHDGAAT